MLRRLLLLICCCATFTASAHARQPPLRMVIATDVACRASPDTTSPVLVRYVVGDLFVVRDQMQGERGVWYLDNSRTRGDAPGCWISGSLTADATDARTPLLAAVDRMLARTDQPAFEEFVAIDNLLLQRSQGPYRDTTILQDSPLLQLRRLQLLERTADAPATSRESVRRDPLKAAWFFANRDVLRFFEPAGSWFVMAEVFWDLYERHRATEWAEEIAWAAAEAAAPRDECDGGCVLDVLLQTHARYWAEFPQGSRVADALARAERFAAAGAAMGCLDSTADAVSVLAARLRSSLAAVTAPGRDALIGHASAIERACREAR